MKARTAMGLAAAAALMAGPAAAQGTGQAAPKPATGELGLKVEIQPEALALVKAMSDRLAAAKTMSFTALTSYESPDRTGEPLIYTTLSEVTLQRPNKLRVISPGDGPRTEFYYDGKMVHAWEPASRIVASVQAPDTIDGMLRAAFEYAAIYFPFTDVIVADPFQTINEHLQVAFVVGKSKVVGGVTTDIVVLVGKFAHVQLWIGSEDKLPRMARAIFVGDPSHYRHTVQFSDWKIDPVLPPDTFTWTPPAGAVQVPFARPDSPPRPAGSKQ